MDEAELARRAARRRLITEDQLREAQSFAEGGRSLLSVLLDLGYLRTDQLPSLMDIPVPPPPRFRRGRWIAALVIAAFLSFSVGRCEEGRSREWSERQLRSENARLRFEAARKEAENVGLGPVPQDRKAVLFGHLRDQGLETLADAEFRLKSAGRLTPEVRSRFQQGAALLDAASAQGRLNDANFLTLGRAREVLLEWDAAYRAYERSLATNPRQPRAMLGAARASLELGEQDRAFTHAEAAIFLAPSAEAYLLRAQGALGRKGLEDQVRRDLLKARELDPSLSPAVASLLERISRY